MRLNKIALGLALTIGALAVTACNDDNDSSSNIGGDNNNGNESSLSYSDFYLEYNDSNNKRSVTRSDIKISANNVLSTYTTFIDNGTSNSDDLTTSFVLANNFTYEAQEYVDNFKFDADISNLVSRVNKNSIDISYKSKNGKVLNFNDPFNNVNISNQPLAIDSDDTGVRVGNLGNDSNNAMINEELRMLSFPSGSECIMFGNTTGDFPYYDFELENYDAVTGKLTPNTVQDFTTLEQLLTDQSRYYDNAKTAVIENVGINNTIRAVHFTDDNDSSYEYAYVEYKGAVYYSSYEQQSDEVVNYDPNVEDIRCDGYNKTAADFLQNLYIKYSK